MRLAMVDDHRTGDLEGIGPGFVDMGYALGLEQAGIGLLDDVVDLRRPGCGA